MTTLNSIRSSAKETLPSTVGVCGAGAALLTGPTTFWHELGHVLTAKLLYKMQGMPRIWIAGFDRFGAIFSARTSRELLEQTSSWLSGGLVGPKPAHWPASLPPDTIGFTHWNERGLTSLGQFLGADGSGALVSIAGPLMVKASCGGGIIWAVRKRKEAPRAAAGVLAFCLVTHLLTSSHSWKAALMSATQLADAASKGHDFAQFAINLSKITGASAHSIATTTALAWTTSLPLFTTLLLFKQKNPISFDHALSSVKEGVEWTVWLSSWLFLTPVGSFLMRAPLPSFMLFVHLSHWAFNYSDLDLNKNIAHFQKQWEKYSDLNGGQRACLRTLLVLRKASRAGITLLTPFALFSTGTYTLFQRTSGVFALSSLLSAYMQSRQETTDENLKTRLLKHTFSDPNVQKIAHFLLNRGWLKKETIQLLLKQVLLDDCHIKPEDIVQIMAGLVPTLNEEEQSIYLNYFKACYAKHNEEEGRDSSPNYSSAEDICAR